MATFNGLRRYLHSRGCVEVTAGRRGLHLAGNEPQKPRTYVRVECGPCSGGFSFVEGRAAVDTIGPSLLATLERALDRCLGAGWSEHIDQDPFR